MLPSIGPQDTNVSSSSRSSSGSSSGSRSGSSSGSSSVSSSGGIAVGCSRHLQADILSRSIASAY